MQTDYTYSDFHSDQLEREMHHLADVNSYVETTYSRDSLGRLAETSVLDGNNGYKTVYTYIPRQNRTWVQNGGIIRPTSVQPTGLADGYWQTTDVGTTGYIATVSRYKIENGVSTSESFENIAYDANGNITQCGGTTYVYDKLNRLVRENNSTLDKTTTWCYDISGNILSRTEYAYTTGDLTGIAPTATFAYTYGSNWKDQLVSFNGQSIAYDQAGNPTAYRGMTLGWIRGRMLNSATTGSKNISIAYDANGIRTRKIATDSVFKVTTDYTYSGNTLLQEKVLTEINGVSLSAVYKTYLHNSQGIVGFIHQGNTYIYHKNIFGDIVAIYNGSTKIAEYAYDAWGNCTIVSDTDGIGANNPFRYRGYYFDTDLGLYYLMSRYYDPQTGRFINADSLEYLDPDTIGGLNLYAYCLNNPIMYADPSGCFPIVACILGLTALVGLGLTIGGVASDNNLMTAIGLTMVAIPALISGGMALACVGAWGTMVIGGITAVAGVGTGLFASAEYQEAFKGTNWMLDAGMSEGFYNGLMLATASIATAGTFASLAGVGKYATAAKGWGSVTKNGKTISPVQNMRRHFIKHVLNEKRYTLGTNIYAYSNNARVLNNTINVWKVSNTSGNLIGKAILNGKEAKLIRDAVTGLILSLC